MIWDTIIIGGGAAGLMTAITAKRAGVGSVLILDTKEKVGAKILMSGGTRCNLTNLQITENDYQTRQPNILKSVLKFFPSAEALRFFQDLGVEAVLEEGGKYFPVSHSGHTVLDALLKEMHRLQIELQTLKKVTHLSFESGRFKVVGDRFSFESQTAVLTTGGLSYPTTGSDGTGYALAGGFGHGLIPTSPSLTPLKSSDQDFHSLSGLALPVELTHWDPQGKKKRSLSGDFLFTHLGYSGPVVLDISRHWIREGGVLSASFLPQYKEEDFEALWLREIKTRPGRQVGSFLVQHLPARWVEILFKKAGLSETVVQNQLTKEKRERLLEIIFRCSLKVTQALGYLKAEVTAGGVDLAEVHRKNLESKLQPGLFFAGEILDVDGRIGGFNFQWAWASGRVAGLGVSKKIQAGLENN